MSPPPPAGRDTLKRDLGTLQSYAVLLGMLVGAGIFRVTSDATALTGPSVILGHAVLALIILATAVAYQVFLSTSLGTKPGGEVLHIARTFGSERLTFLAAWLKLITYLGAAAYLAHALGANVLELLDPQGQHGDGAVTVAALLLLGLFFAIQVAGVGWFGRIQVTMCVILAIALLVLIVPGLFAIETQNFRPFFTGGVQGFGAALPQLFFAYAGFESLSQAAGEVRDSRTRLPRVFFFGILATALLFIAMSTVAFGVLPASELGGSQVPMSEAARRYLPFGADRIVTLGAVMAVATSLNAALFVPARLAFHLAQEQQLPKAFGYLHPRFRTPTVGLAINFALTALLVVSGRMGLALGIAVVSLMCLYALHSVALLMLPRRHPELYREAATTVPRWAQVGAAGVSVIALLVLVAVHWQGDLVEIAKQDWAARQLTSLELFALWLVAGSVLHAWMRHRRTP